MIESTSGRTRSVSTKNAFATPTAISGTVRVPLQSSNTLPAVELSTCTFPLPGSWTSVSSPATESSRPGTCRGFIEMRSVISKRTIHLCAAHRAAESIERDWPQDDREDGQPERVGSEFEDAGAGHRATDTVERMRDRQRPGNQLQPVRQPVDRKEHAAEQRAETAEEHRRRRLLFEGHDARRAQDADRRHREHRQREEDRGGDYVDVVELQPEAQGDGQEERDLHERQCERPESRRQDQEREARRSCHQDLKRPDHLRAAHGLLETMDRDALETHEREVDRDVIEVRGRMPSDAVGFRRPDEFRDEEEGHDLADDAEPAAPEVDRIGERDARVTHEDRARLLERAIHYALPPSLRGRPRTVPRRVA